MTNCCLFGDGEINRGRVSTPYSPPRYRRNSNLQLALAVRRDLKIIFQSAVVSSKLCERHDPIGSNLPIVKPIKTAWDSGKEHQVRGTNCRCSFVMHMLGTKLPSMGDTSNKAPSHKPDKPLAVTSEPQDLRSNAQTLSLQTRFSAEQTETVSHSNACCRFVTTVQTDDLGKPTVSETHSLGTDNERDTMPKGRKND